MNNYSQNNEQQTVIDYFKNFIGTFLDLGANDGITLSNTYALVWRGWDGTFVEASPEAFKRLSETHKDNDRLVLLNFAAGNFDGEIVLHESGQLLGQGDISLVSSTKPEELKRWESISMPFTPVTVPCATFKTLQLKSKYAKYDFISIDIEGLDIDLLRQMDLKELGCKCLCIEHNGNESVLQEVANICNWYGLNQVLLKNAENIIYAV